MVGINVLGLVTWKQSKETLFCGFHVAQWIRQDTDEDLHSGFIGQGSSPIRLHLALAVCFFAVTLNIKMQQEIVPLSKCSH